MSAANITTRPPAGNGHHTFEQEPNACLPSLQTNIGLKAGHPEIISKVGVQFGPSQDFVLDIYNTDLPEAAPLALWIGGRGGALGLHAAGVKLVRLRPLAKTTTECLLAAAKNAVTYVCGHALEIQSRGVYLIGHGIGALLISKLLADKQLMKESPGSQLLQGAYFVAGVFEINEEIKHQMSECSKMRKDSVSSNSSSSSASPYKEFPKQSFMIEDLLNVHMSFEDRKNLSFICDLNNSPSFNDSRATDKVKKIKQTHGLINTSEDALKTSPVYQNVFDFVNKKSVDSEKTPAQSNDLNAAKLSPQTHAEDCDSIHEGVSLYVRLLKDLRIGQDENIIISSLHEDFSHLWCTGFRIYVFAAGSDGQTLVKQSRELFETLTEGCKRSGSSHFEVKDNIDSGDVINLLDKEDNFLRRMIRYDIVKHL